MTDREKAIVMAYTGVCMLAGEKLDMFYQYLNELYGRPVYTHEWVTLDIKEKSKSDFLQLCKEEEKHGRWVKMSDADSVYWACSECGEDLPRVSHFNPQFDLFPRYESIDKTPYCPNCGVKMEE